MLWAFYKEDNKGYKTFEEYCQPLVDMKNKLLKSNV